jgi:hypothetical protein
LRQKALLEKKRVLISQRDISLKENISNNKDLGGKHNE